MKYLYDIPPRLKVKKGLAGNIENKDLIASAVLCGIGLIGIFTVGQINMIAGLVFLGLSVATAWILFLNPYKFEEPLRVWIGRYKAFNASQKIFYYRRANNPIIHLKKE